MKIANQLLVVCAVKFHIYINMGEMKIDKSPELLNRDWKLCQKLKDYYYYYYFV